MSAIPLTPLHIQEDDLLTTYRLEAGVLYSSHRHATTDYPLALLEDGNTPIFSGEWCLAHIPTPVRRVTASGGAHPHLLAIGEDGSVFGCGYNHTFQLGSALGVVCYQTAFERLLVPAPVREARPLPGYTAVLTEDGDFYHSGHTLYDEIFGFTRLSLPGRAMELRWDTTLLVVLTDTGHEHLIPLRVRSFDDGPALDDGRPARATPSDDALEMMDVETPARTPSPDVLDDYIIRIDDDYTIVTSRLAPGGEEGEEEGNEAGGGACESDRR